MKERKATAKAIADLISQLSNEELVALTDRRHRGLLHKFLEELILEDPITSFVEYLEDNEVMKRFPQFSELIPKYRRLANELGYSGPMVWLIKAGFTLRRHAPQAGPCQLGFIEKAPNMEIWDEPTNNCLVFWIPRELMESREKNRENQMELLANMRERFELPEHHLSSFGSAALNAALLFAEFRRSGDRAARWGYVRTDSYFTYPAHRGFREALCLRFYEEGLADSNRHVHDDAPYHDIRCFALGVETL